MNTSKDELKENLAYLMVWLLLLLTPIISMGVRMVDDSQLTFRWEAIIREWRVILPFLIVFVVHNYMIAPLLIYKKKKWLYVALTLCVLAVFQTYQCQHRPPFERGHQKMGMHDGGRHERPDLPTLPRNSADSNEVADFGRHPAAEPRHPGEDRPGHFDGKAPFDRHMGEPPFLRGEHDIMAIIVMLLMIAANLGVKQYYKSLNDRKRLQDLERKTLEQQLEYLKYQINPHFFMNTLNNIHALVDIEPEEAKHSIVELSKMMRYVLYEGAKSSVPLQKDIEFLRNYVTLMKLRYTDKVSIRFDVPDDITNKMVPPMLLITFVENAFKHGVSYRNPSFIDIHITTSGDTLTFVCRNSKTDKEPDLEGGVGLKNTRQRLDLIYGNDYRLDIDDGEDTYEVTLELKLHDKP